MLLNYACTLTVVRHNEPFLSRYEVVGGVLLRACFRSQLPASTNPSKSTVDPVKAKRKTTHTLKSFHDIGVGYRDLTILESPLQFRPIVWSSQKLVRSFDRIRSASCRFAINLRIA